MSDQALSEIIGTILIVHTGHRIGRGCGSLKTGPYREYPKGDL